MRNLFRKIKKGIRKVFGKARWFILAAVISLVGYVILMIIDDEGIDKTILENKSVALDQNSFASVNEEGNVLIRNESFSAPMLAMKNLETGKQLMFDKCDNFIEDRYGPAYYLKDVVIGEDDNYYAVILCYESEADVILNEKVIHLRAGSGEIEEIYTVTPREGDITVYKRLTGLHYEEGILNFVYVDYDKTVLFRYDTKKKSEPEQKVFPSDPSGTFIFSALPIGISEDGDSEFLLQRSDGNVYRVSMHDDASVFANPEALVYHFDETLDDFSLSRIIGRAEVLDGKMYVLLKRDTQIYTLEEKTLTPVIDLSDYFPGTGAFPINLGTSGGKLFIGTLGGVGFYDNGTMETYVITAGTKTWYRIRYSLVGFFLFALAISAGGLFINLLIRKKTITYKYLVSFMPIMAIFIFVVAQKMYERNLDDNLDARRSQVYSTCELCLHSFEEEDYSALFRIGEDTGEAASRLHEKLNMLIGGRMSDWSKSYDFLILAKNSDGSLVPLASNSDFVSPLTQTLEKHDIEMTFPEEGEVTVNETIYDFLSENSGRSEIHALGRIPCAERPLYLMVRARNAGMWYSQRNLFFFILDYFAIAFLILLLVVSLNAIYITRGIKKVTKTVSKISAGDLTARVNYKWDDELGDICKEVDRMAGNLNSMFDEKDRTERFYYKFVPEKFREYLDKESFTDLQLGDARSRELTVLFCDIRSFSINSEIMTAKENFEFINKVYGKAGPIIREHNGFVDKFIGDAVMALFENADDAVRCGIEMYRAIVLNPEMAEELKVSGINIGIGIHSGMSMVGIVGETERLSGTVISDTVNMSSRLESLTKQYKTAMLISKDTVDRLSDADAYRLRYLGILQVAGINEAKGVYEVLDCLPEEIREERDSHKEALREAVRLFHLGDRKAAAEMLSQIEYSEEKDGIIGRYRTFIESLPEEETANVFRFTKK